MTVDGFRTPGDEGRGADAQRNGDYLGDLYVLMAMHDREGLRKHIEKARSPFQKTLGLASLVHELIRLGLLDVADKYAAEIPSDKSDCTLARAEVITAIGAGWSVARVPDHARLRFELALEEIAVVGTDLAYGKAVTVASVAAGQASAGLMASSATTFELALKLAEDVPARPKPVKGVYPKVAVGQKFRGDAHRIIFDTALRTRDLGCAPYRRGMANPRRR